MLYGSGSVARRWIVRVGKSCSGEFRAAMESVGSDTATRMLKMEEVLKSMSALRVDERKRVWAAERTEAVVT